MALKTLIQDGEGTKRTAGVTEDHALKVTPLSISLRDLSSEGNLDYLTRTKVFVETLKNSASSQNLNIDGSVTPIDFYISAIPNKVVSVYRIKFIFHDEQMALEGSEGNRFGQAAAKPGLTNGLRFFVEQEGFETNIFYEPVQYVAQFLHYSDDLYNQPGGLGAGEDILIIQMKFEQPVHIVPGGIDRLVVKVQDDLTLVNFFHVVAIGTQEYL